MTAKSSAWAWLFTGLRMTFDPGFGLKARTYWATASAALAASFSANFEAPVLMARACAQHMSAKGVHGAIVLVSSMQGVHPFEGSRAYAGPKAALVHAGRSRMAFQAGDDD